jgi:PPOX class probable F420-dependent enzyme
MRQRVREARVGRLATADRTGQPHVVACCFALEAPTHVPGSAAVAGDRIYSAVDAKPKTTLALRRLANIAENPAVSLLVDHYDDDWSTLWWVRVDGVAHVVEADEEREHALTLLANKYPQYRREPPPGPAIVVDISRWRAWP